MDEYIEGNPFSKKCGIRKCNPMAIKLNSVIIGQLMKANGTQAFGKDFYIKPEKVKKYILKEKNRVKPNFLVIALSKMSSVVC